MSVTSDSQPLMEQAEFAPRKDSYPMCIVWSVIPGLSWLLPPVGHLGITASEGTISDFAGPYYIHKSKKRTAFGPVNKYLRVLPTEISFGATETAQEAWDRAIAAADKLYEGRMHNLIADNCRKNGLYLSKSGD